MNGPFRIVSLCSGIGGLELGLERAGLGHVVVQVEIDAKCRAVLARHWPKAKRHDDLKTWDCQVPGAGPILLCGGFPCQPYSKAGAGLAENDPRDLWPVFARKIREVGPEVLVLENVERLLQLGMGRVLGDLAALGYRVEWDCIPAAAVGAPHLRDRVFILAYADRSGLLHGQAAEQPAIGRQPALSLSVAVQRWPTPTVSGNYNRKGASMKSGDGLATAVRRWPTPTATGQHVKNSQDDWMGLEAAVRSGLWPTPTADDTGARRSPYSQGGTPLSLAVNGRLNPLWVEWLMGFPPGWTDCASSETPSSPTSPSSSAGGSGL